MPALFDATKSPLTDAAGQLINDAAPDALFLDADLLDALGDGLTDSADAPIEPAPEPALAECGEQIEAGE